MTDIPETGLQIRSLVKSNATLELSLAEIPVPEPGPEEVLIRIEATPINPSDLGLLVSSVDMSTAKSDGPIDRPVVTAQVPQVLMRAMGARLDQSLAVGNEGAGVVVKAGSSDAAQAMLGKTVSAVGGDMYSQYRCLHVRQCLPLPDDASPRDGASCFVNPLTALGMTETMRMEGHSALVHTAAASNLGQMLNKICLADGIDLVNIVRKQEQAEILKGIGAKHIVDSSAPGFMENLIDALVQTKATLAFDAIGGGSLAGQILVAMETAASQSSGEYSRYGSTTHKQVYIYGRLSLSPTTLGPGVGMAWGVGGWLLTPFLQKIGTEGRNKLQTRVVSELKSTFASHYTREISLVEALQLPVIEAYSRRATGEKFLINPNKV